MTPSDGSLGVYVSACNSEKKTQSAASWGGIPVVVFLDEVQLPPVCDSPVYNNHLEKPTAMRGVLVWGKFTIAVSLKNIVRQNDSMQQLRTTFMALREYKTTKDQAAWLQKFQWTNLRLSYGQELLS